MKKDAETAPCPFFGGMSNLLPKAITTYLRNNPAWLFMSVLLFFSYWLTQAAGTGSLTTFLRCLASLTMFCAPFLTLAHLWPGLSPRVRKLTLVLVYGIYGLALVVLRPSIQSLPFTRYVLATESFTNQWALPIVITTLGVLQLGLWLLGRRKQKPQVFRWLQKLPLAWLAVGVVVFISIGITLFSNGVQVAAEELTSLEQIGLYLAVFLQAVAVYLPYYGLYYLHHHVLFRDLLQQKGLLHYLLGAVALVLMFAAIHGSLIAWLPAVRDYFIHPVGIVGEVMNDVNLSLGISVLILSLPFIVVVEWYRKEQDIKELQAEKSGTELQLLKEQINPHFFFNTLNNLYAMSLTQEETTPDTILKLSDLMRYVIYRGKEAMVPLKEEVQYLRDYLDLQAIRLHKSLDLSFEVSLTNEARPVAPLLFIILVENAFKHGVEPAEENCFLHLHLSEGPNGISFRCRNSYESGAESSERGIGLDNLKRRLDLLYPEQYLLELNQNATEFTAILTLEA